MEDPEKVLERVGRRIAELREKAGATQAEVAGDAGMTVNNYQRIEHGLQNLTIKTMVSIAGALRVPVIKLFEPVSSKAIPKKSGPGRPKKVT